MHLRSDVPGYHSGPQGGERKKEEEELWKRGRGRGRERERERREDEWGGGGGGGVCVGGGGRGERESHHTHPKPQPSFRKLETKTLPPFFGSILCQVMVAAKLVASALNGQPFG